MSNNEKNEELRRNVLREFQMYLSDYLSEERAEKLFEEYIPNLIDLRTRDCSIKRENYNFIT